MQKSIRTLLHKVLFAPPGLFPAFPSFSRQQSPSVRSFSFPLSKNRKNSIMNRALTLILALLFGTCLLAQSSNSKFIDSPAWVLAGEGNLDDMPSPVAAVSPSQSQNRHEKTAASVNKAANGASSKTSASSRGGGRSTNEGFLHVGIYVTPTLNWLSSVDKNDAGGRRYERTGSNFSATPTVMLDMRLFRRFYLGVGVAYNTWGGKISAINGEYDFKRSFSFSYLEIPVRVKIQTRNFSESRASMFFSAGANLGFGVRYAYTDKYTDLSISDPISATGDFITAPRKIKENRKLANLSAVGQIGVNYQFGRHLNLLVGIEYHYGFIRPLKENADNEWPDFNNQQIGLVVGIMF